MKVKVVDVDRSDPHCVLVCFECRAGVGAAVWSEDEAPVVGNRYGVELDIDTTLTSEHKVVGGGAPTLKVDGRDVFFDVWVDSVDPDGVIYLRLALDALVMVESSGGIAPGDRLRFGCRARDVSLTVIGC